MVIDSSLGVKDLVEGFDSFTIFEELDDMDDLFFIKEDEDDDFALKDLESFLVVFLKSFFSSLFPLLPLSLDF